MSGPGEQTFFPAYRPRASALHAASATVGAAFCLALAAVFVLFESPWVLGAGLVAVVVAGFAAKVGGELGRAARIGVPIALLLALLNPLVSSDGATLLVRGWALVGHRFDITLEALAYGGVAGVRILGLVLAFALFSAAVDPDELLRALRRISYRSALTAALATRLVPVLARDASARGEAARCRARPASRVALARAALAGSLERASEVAAALEVRGYARAGAAPRRAPGAVVRAGVRPQRRSRHDLALAASAVALVGVTVAAKVADVGAFVAYPRLEAPIDAAELVVAGALVGLAAAPFAGARARLGVARRAPGAVGA